MRQQLSCIVLVSAITGFAGSGDPQPTAVWPCDEGVGAFAREVDRAAWELTLSPSVKWAKGCFGVALALEGRGDRVFVPAVPQAKGGTLVYRLKPAGESWRVEALPYDGKTATIGSDGFSGYVDDVRIYPGPVSGELLVKIEHDQRYAESEGYQDDGTGALGSDLMNDQGCLFDVGSRKLPGEDVGKPPIPCSPFPDMMSAFVWRNWTLVPKEKLARIVGACADDLTRVAVEMGLPADPVVLPDWRRKGYITVLRRNWHILPYSQLLELLSMTRDEMHFVLMEDDFLWVKLGGVKPKCESLRWDAEEVAKSRDARKRIAATLREENVAAVSEEEPRFSFLRELATVDDQSDCRSSVVQTDTPFSFRLISSYCAEYVDPLSDPEISSFPEGLVQKLSKEGVNAVWMHVVLRTLVKDARYPEFGEGCERRMANLQKLVDRCRKYGVRVFLYMNEPRGLDPSFFKVPGRESLGGARHGVLQAMCTLNPETQRWLSDSLESLFSTVHGLGGIFTITASENLTNCATRPGDKETCSVCRSHTRAEIIAAANGAMARGMLKGDSKAEALIWDWAWPADEVADIISRLPKNGCRLMAVSEHGIPIFRGGVREVEDDYSISIVGPGESACRLWKLACQNGIPTVAKVQASCSWELSSFPYVPVMDLVAEHAVNLADAGVDGVMLSWSLGGYPSANLSVYSELRKGEKNKEGVLDRLSKRLYGDKATRARKAWTAFSDGFTNYPFSCQTLYVGPQQWGVANPLYVTNTGYAATMVGIPYDDLDGWRRNYPRETYAALIGKVAEGFAEGCRLMDGVATMREVDMFRAEQMHFASCCDQSLFIMARDTGDITGMRRTALAELARAKTYLPIVRADSRIGFESSCQYYFTPIDVVEKILSCRVVIDSAADQCAGSPHISVFGASVLKIAKERGLTVEQAASRLYDLGVRGFDMSVFDTNLERLAETKLRPVNLFYFARFSDGDFGRKEHAKALDVAARCGVRQVMTILPHFTEMGDREPEFVWILGQLKELVAMARARGIVITVEDYGNVKNACSSAKYIKRMLDEIPDLHLTVDTGNLYYAGRGDDILDVMEYAGARVSHIHLKDQMADDNHKFVTLGTGVVPNEQIVRASKVAGYQGWYTLEEPVGDVLSDISRQIEVLKVWHGAR